MQDDFQKCISVLLSGGVILYPTDTIWGLGCDATNEVAIQRIKEIKERPDSKTMIVLCGSWQMVADYFGAIDELERFSLQYLDRPTTFVFIPKKNNHPWLIADDGTIAVRVTGEAFSANLCNEFGKPIISTSANLSNQFSPAGFLDIDEKIVNAVDYIVRHHYNEVNKNTASRIVRVLDGKAEILRD